MNKKPDMTSSITQQQVFHFPPGHFQSCLTKEHTVSKQLRYTNTICSSGRGLPHAPTCCNPSRPAESFSPGRSGTCGLAHTPQRTTSRLASCAACYQTAERLHSLLLLQIRFYFTPLRRPSCKRKALCGWIRNESNFIPAADLCRFVLGNMRSRINLLSGCPCYLHDVYLWFSAKGRLTASWRREKKD